MPAELDAGWQRAFVELLQGSHLATDEDLAEQVDSAVAWLGMSAELFLVDHEQYALHPIRPGAGDALSIEGTLAGRAFQSIEVLGTGHEDPATVWAPLVDGLERLGVLRYRLPPGTDPREMCRSASCALFAGLAGHLVMTKTAYGDAFARARRTQPMSVASELLWTLQPPLTFGCRGLTLSAVLQPAYQVGGDGFDYAVTGRQAYLAVFDGMGHDLSAGLTTAVAIAAGRAARRCGADIASIAEDIDRAVAEQFPDHRFVTGLLGRLDLDTGTLRYVNAGHPPALVLRSGKAVLTLDGGRRLPFGLGALAVAEAARPDEVGATQLEPDDRLLLYTDGVVDAQDPAGDPFGLARLVDLAVREAGAGLPAPETVRRLSHAVLEHRDHELRDDATLLLVEWSGDAPEQLLPDAHPSG